MFYASLNLIKIILFGKFPSSISIFFYFIVLFFQFRSIFVFNFSGNAHFLFKFSVFSYGKGLRPCHCPKSFSGLADYPGNRALAQLLFSVCILFFCYLIHSCFICGSFRGGESKLTVAESPNRQRKSPGSSFLSTLGIIIEVFYVMYYIKSYCFPGFYF